MEIVTAVKALLLLAGSVGLGFVTVYFFRDRKRVGEVLVDWWVEESHAPSGRRRWSSGHWGSKKWLDLEARKQVAAWEGWGLVILFGTGTLVLFLACISVLLRG
jgi:hypothetical protein